MFTNLLPGATKSAATMQQMENLVSQQALMIGYIDDFKLMMIITLCALPLAWILKKPEPREMAPGQAPVAHD